MEPRRKPEVLLAKEDNPRVKQLAQRSRSAFDDEGQPSCPRASASASATRSSRRSSTASMPIRRSWPTARRTATGAARLPSIAG